MMLGAGDLLALLAGDLVLALLALLVLLRRGDRELLLLLRRDAPVVRLLPP